MEEVHSQGSLPLPKLPRPVALATPHQSHTNFCEVQNSGSTSKGFLICVFPSVGDNWDDLTQVLNWVLAVIILMTVNTPVLGPWPSESFLDTNQQGPGM